MVRFGAESVSRMRFASAAARAALLHKPVSLQTQQMCSDGVSRKISKWNLVDTQMVKRLFHPPRCIRDVVIVETWFPSRRN